MPADPAWCVEVTLEPEVLLMRLHLRVLGVHVLRRRWDLLLLQRGIEIWGVGEVGVVAAVVLRCVGLQHLDEQVIWHLWLAAQIIYIWALLLLLLLLLDISTAAREVVVM